MLDLFYNLRKLSKEQRHEQKKAAKQGEPTCFYRDYLSEETLRMVIKKNYDPAKNGENDFYYLAVRKEERFKLFIDIKLLLKPKENAYEGYQKREPDALNNMERAFEFIYVSRREPLTVDLIQQLHCKAAAHLKREVSAGYGWGLAVKKKSIEGILKTSHFGYITFSTKKISQCGLFKMFDHFEKVYLPTTFEFDEEGGCIEKVIENRIRADVIYPEEGYFSKINKIIEKYEKKVKSEDPLEKLKSIVGFIQSLDFLHPFYDGNTRVFETLLLNRELVRHNFTPALLYDPNLFTCSSKKEVLFDVVRGMENFVRFQTQGEIVSSMKISC